MKIVIENQTHTDRNINPDEVRSGSARDVTDFFELRHQLVLENREIDNMQEVPAGRVNHERRLVSSLISAERVEAALFWFISAPAILYLIYLIARPLIGAMP